MPINDRELCAHLLRRAAFGAGPDDVAAAAGRGYEASVDAVLAQASRKESRDYARLLDQMRSAAPRAMGRLRPPLLRTWWLARLIATERPFVEKMTLFWHGHFATSASKVSNGELLYRQNEFLRAHALGRFQDLVLGISRDPAMLLWLDNHENVRAHPNENFARELMELFTCGIGHYTERDVREAARAFTGWTVRPPREFVFAVRQHDFADKVFLGRKGPWDGKEIVEMLVAHPATRRFICEKLWRFFAQDSPTEADLRPLLDAWKRSGGVIADVMRALFLSPGFTSDRARFAHIKSPVEFAIGTIRLSGLPAAPDGPGARTRRMRFLGAGLPNSLKKMGQDLFYPPDVKGWDGGRAWVNTATLAERASFARQLFRGAGRAAFGLRPLVVAGSPAETVDRLCERLGGVALQPATRQRLAETVKAEGPLAGAAALVASPEYQLA